jgi:hypothetical protein
MRIFGWFERLRPQIELLSRNKPDLKFQKKTVIYGCEIARCIPKGERSPDLEYCQGWADFKGMGISVICAYSSWDERYHIYDVSILRRLYEQRARLIDPTNGNILALP